MREDMKRVAGIGGIFFESDDPEKLYQWYENYLGIRRAPDGTGAVFEWREVNDTQSKGMLCGRFFRPAQNISLPAIPCS
jgi:hypothetical protein